MNLLPKLCWFRLGHVLTNALLHHAQLVNMLGDTRVINIPNTVNNALNIIMLNLKFKLCPSHQDDLCIKAHF